MPRMVYVGCLLLMPANGAHGSDAVFTTRGASVSQSTMCGDAVLRIHPVHNDRAPDGTVWTTLLIEVLDGQGQTAALSFQRHVPGSCLFLSWMSKTTVASDDRFQTSLDQFRVYGSSTPPLRGRAIGLELTVRGRKPADTPLDVRTQCGTHGRTVWLPLLPRTYYELRFRADGGFATPRVVSATKTLTR